MLLFNVLQTDLYTIYFGPFVVQPNLPGANSITCHIEVDR